jgi:CHAD domain-containing protein
VPLWRGLAASANQSLEEPRLTREASAFRSRRHACAHNLRIAPGEPNRLNSVPCRVQWSLHQTRHGTLRKAAKWARYVSDALVSALRKKARRIGQTTRQLQQTLGEYQDCVIVKTFRDEVRHEGQVGEEQSAWTRWGAHRDVRPRDVDGRRPRRLRSSFVEAGCLLWTT